MRPGDILADRFEVERLAGVGGMGEVFRAFDRRSGELVALKLCLAQTEEQVARFQREVRVLSMLRHPGIARYVAHGISENGRYYLAMEWLEGEDLSARLQRGPLPISETLLLVARVAEALGGVHERGIIHRDLKPSNIFLPAGRVEQVKILDFGVARSSDATHGLTGTGSAIGTPAYMAPEQVRGEPRIDGRADLYALGCVLFECVTGRPPFVAPHPVAVLAKILFEEPPQARELCPGLPEPVNALVADLLAKRPEDRPPNSEDVVRKLQDMASVNRGAPWSAAAVTALTSIERRFISVVLATNAIERGTHKHSGDLAYPAASVHDDTLAAPPPPLSGRTWLQEVHDVADRYGARLEILSSGSIVAALMGEGTPGDVAANAARFALALRRLVNAAGIAVAAGWDEVSGAQSMGQVIDRGGAMLVSPGFGGDEPCPIRLDPATASLIEARFYVIGRGGEPVLTGEREVENEARTLLGKQISCVGRDRELRFLEDLFNECVSDSRARAVLVSGEAGMGKSRLRIELVRRLLLRFESLQVWFAQSESMRAQASLGLLGQIIRGATRVVDGEPVELSRGKLRERVARRVGASMQQRVAEFLGEIVGVLFPQEESVQLRAARQDPMLMGDQMRRAWVDFLDAECRTGPVLILMDDIHWGDRATMDFIDVALRMLSDRPILVLALARPEVHDQFPRLWAERGMEQIRLGELSRRACEALVRQALGHQISTEHIQKLIKRSSGNAFFLEELVRAAAAGEDVESAPETVLAVVQSRFAGLSFEARSVLRAGSVFGEAFWRGGLERLLGWAPTASLLKELERQEWILRRHESRIHEEGEFVFGHNLFREAAYAMLTDQDRTLGHRLAGEWLTEVKEHDSLTLADHFERGGDLARALICYEQSAGQALESNDLSAVIKRVEKGLACGAQGETSGKLHIWAATARNWEGNFQEAARHARLAVELMPRASEQWYAAIDCLVWASGSLEDIDRIENIAELLQESSPQQLERSAISALCNTTGWLYTYGRKATASLLARLVDNVDGKRHEPLVSAHIHEWKGWLGHFSMQVEAVLQNVEASVGFYELAGDLRKACLQRLNVGATLFDLGLYDRAEIVVRQAMEEAEHLGLRYPAVASKMWLGMIQAAQGRLEDGRVFLQEAIGESLASGDTYNERVGRILLARVLLMAGVHEEAEREALTVIEAAPPSWSAFIHALMAQILLSAGRSSDALVYAKRGEEILNTLGLVAAGAGLIRLSIAEALRAVGAHDLACAAVMVAQDWLSMQAQQIQSPDLRRSFVENVPEHARIMAL